MVKKQTRNKDEKIVKEKFKIEGIDYIPYVVGWILGVFNLIFWFILLIVGLASENKHKFVDYTLHKIVYVYGIVMIILIFLALSILIFLMFLGISLFGPMMFFR